MKVQRITYERYGECIPEKCNSACCKILNSDNDKEYFEPIDGICKYLKDDKCSINNYKPMCCSIFPDNPNNPLYKQIKNVCSYWFKEIIEEIDE